MPVHYVPFKALGPAHSPHDFSELYRATLYRKKKKVFILLGSSKHPLGPSVTASSLSAVQDGLHVQPALPRAVRAGKTCMPHVMFQTSPSAKSGRCESNTKLSLIFRICYSAGSTLVGNTCCHKSQAVTILNSKQCPILTEFKAEWLCNKKVSLLALSQSVTQSLVQTAVHAFTHLVIQNAPSVNILFISSAGNTYMHLFYILSDSKWWKKSMDEICIL